MRRETNKLSEKIDKCEISVRQVHEINVEKFII